jgi:hypothetical protein
VNPILIVFCNMHAESKKIGRKNLGLNSPIF